MTETLKKGTLISIDIDNKEKKSFYGQLVWILDKKRYWPGYIYDPYLYPNLHNWVFDNKVCNSLVAKTCTFLVYFYAISKKGDEQYMLKSASQLYVFDNEDSIDLALNLSPKLKEGSLKQIFMTGLEIAKKELKLPVDERLGWHKSPVVESKWKPEEVSVSPQTEIASICIATISTDTISFSPSKLPAALIRDVRGFSIEGRKQNQESFQTGAQVVELVHTNLSDLTSKETTAEVSHGFDFKANFVGERNNDNDVTVTNMINIVSPNVDRCLSRVNYIGGHLRSLVNLKLSEQTEQNREATCLLFTQLTKLMLSKSEMSQTIGDEIFQIVSSTESNRNIFVQFMTNLYMERWVIENIQHHI